MAPVMYDRPVSDIDDIDRRMIDRLRADGRRSAPQLAADVGIGRATAYHRFDALVEAGVIARFSAIVDPKRVGLDVSALVMVDVEQGRWRDLQARLADLPGVEWLGVAAGQHDFVLLVRAESLDHLRDVALRALQEIDGVRSAQTIVLLDEIDQRHRPLWPS